MQTIILGVLLVVFSPLTARLWGTIPYPVNPSVETWRDIQISVGVGFVSEGLTGSVAVMLVVSGVVFVALAWWTGYRQRT